MPIRLCGCQCGSTEGTLRNFLKRCGYPEWLNIEVIKGKSQSLALLDTIPQFPEVEMLRSHIRDSSKWAVVLGFDENNCRWSDLTRGKEKAAVEAELVVKYFA